MLAFEIRVGPRKLCVPIGIFGMHYAVHFFSFKHLTPLDFHALYENIVRRYSLKKILVNKVLTGIN